MRRLLLIAFALPIAASAQSWVVLDQSPFDNYRFEDAAFLSPERGWIVNGDGETFETQDGGETWQMRSRVPGYLRTTAFPSADIGWIGVLFNVNARLYETRDGGTTLVNVTDRIQPAIDGGVCGLFALDEQHVFGVGEWDGPAYFIKTTDGGATWQSRDMTEYVGSLIDVRFTDPMNGIVVGGSNGIRDNSVAVVLATSDGGATWTERFRSSGEGTNSEWAWKLSFPSDDVGYVSVEHDGSDPDGKVLKTTDGGLTWAELEVPGGESMQGIGFIDEQTGWTSGRGTSMVTTDGGATWRETFDFIAGRVNRFEFFGDSLGYAMDTRIYRLERAVVASEGPTATAELSLSASPVPSGGTVTFRYSLPEAGDVALEIFDALGRRVALVHDGPLGTGDHTMTWSPPAETSGIYLARLVAGDRMRTLRVVVTR
ncbi:MAG: T9SS type A sorting domain-containing protein [Bacteroidota bacterium]